MRITVGLIAIVVATGCGSGASNERADPGFSSTEPAPLDRVSNRGTPFSSVLPSDVRALTRMARSVGGGGISADYISILGTRGERSFYRLSEHCYGSGFVSPTNRVFGAMSCTPKFPSRERPVLDFTVYNSSAGPDERPQPQNMTVNASEGIAADGVAKVAFLDAGGRVVADTAVIDNIFRFDPAPAGAGLILVAYDATGEVVFSTP
jgi:hypothetical protein